MPLAAAAWDATPMVEGYPHGWHRRIENNQACSLLFVLIACLLLRRQPAVGVPLTP